MPRPGLTAPTRSRGLVATIALAIAALAFVGACSNGSPGGDTSGGGGSSGGAKSRAYEQPTEVPVVKRPKRTTGRHATATFAAGCFWCVEAIFEHVRGVDEAVSGYSGGDEASPTYEQVARGKTGHAESVQVHYDPDAVTYETLVKVLVGSMDPTQVNGQGPDNGPMYRSVIFVHDDEQRAAALRVLADERTRHKKPLAIEVVAFKKFWPAEDYHQDYEAKNPNDGYIRAVSLPRLGGFKKKFPDLLRQH